MACTDCIEAKPLNICSDEIIIGQLADYISDNLDVFVLVKSLATERIDKYAVTTDEAGTIVLDTLDIEFNENTLYEISVIHAGGSNIYDRQPFLVEGEADAVDCILIRFVDVHENLSTQTVTT